MIDVINGASADAEKIISRLRDDLRSAEQEKSAHEQELRRLEQHIEYLRGVLSPPPPRSRASGAEIQARKEAIRAFLADGQDRKLSRIADAVGLAVGGRPPTRHIQEILLSDPAEFCKGANGKKGYWRLKPAPPPHR